MVKNSTRQRIVAGARRHFFARGFRSVTMDDLTEELGMSKKTLYLHFANKAALLEAVLQDKFRSVDADLNRVTAECSTNFLAALHQLLVCMQRHTQEVQPSFVRDVRRAAPELFQIVQARRRDIIQRHFSKLLAAGQKVGIIRKDIPLKVAIEILLGTTQAIMNPQKIAELNLTPKSGFSAIITVFLEGMITKKGRAKR
jgi:AcrR family transcriptional regulator